MKVAIVIPAFNESAVINKVLKSLPKKLKWASELEVLVIDDGSIDKTYQESLKAHVNVIRHILNRGVGAATKTGLHWARSQNVDIAVTFDADGQHHPEDIEKIIKPIIINKADVVIGSRFRNKQKIPLDRFILNWFANLATFFLFGVFSTDSQSGLRAFSKEALEKIDFKADRMDFSSEILLEAKKNRLKIKEVPIKAVYTAYSRIKGQKNINALPVFARFLIKLLR